MDFPNLRDRALYVVDTTPATKDDVLKRIASIASGKSELSEYTEEDIFSSLSAREQIGSTGFENGVALPHCALEKAKDFVSGVLVVPGGVDFESVDKRASKVFAFIIGPASERNVHIQLLSAYSRILNDRSAVERISGAADSQDLEAIFSEYFQAIDDSHYLERQKPQNLVMAILQDQDYFEDFLQVFSATEHAAISVIDSNNAGNFLNRMPLFSSFWSESQTSFNRIIIAVVERDKCNDLVRRLNTVFESDELPKGVMITVQELAYSTGSLEL